MWIEAAGAFGFWLSCRERRLKSRQVQLVVPHLSACDTLLFLSIEVKTALFQLQLLLSCYINLTVDFMDGIDMLLKMIWHTGKLRIVRIKDSSPSFESLKETLTRFSLLFFLTGPGRDDPLKHVFKIFFQYSQNAIHAPSLIVDCASKEQGPSPFSLLLVPRGELRERGSFRRHGVSVSSPNKKKINKKLSPALTLTPQTKGLLGGGSWKN